MFNIIDKTINIVKQKVPSKTETAKRAIVLKTFNPVMHNFPKWSETL